MITQEQLNLARQQQEEAEKIIIQYHLELLEAFQKRLEDNPIFTDDELIYSRESLCPCGHGLAYPKDCGPAHYWDCSAILKGIADPLAKHCGQMPFMYYEIKAELDEATTRGVFKPQVKV